MLLYSCCDCDALVIYTRYICCCDCAHCALLLWLPCLGFVVPIRCPCLLLYLVVPCYGPCCLFVTFICTPFVGCLGCPSHLPDYPPIVLCYIVPCLVFLTLFLFPVMPLALVVHLGYLLLVPIYPTDYITLYWPAIVTHSLYCCCCCWSVDWLLLLLCCSLYLFWLLRLIIVPLWLYIPLVLAVVICTFIIHCWLHWRCPVIRFIRLYTFIGLICCCCWLLLFTFYYCDYCEIMTFWPVIPLLIVTHYLGWLDPLITQTNSLGVITLIDPLCQTVTHPLLPIASCAMLVWLPIDCWLIVDDYLCPLCVVAHLPLPCPLVCILPAWTSSFASGLCHCC